MSHEISHECPMCGSLMGAEAQPAAMRKAAEIQDQVDRLEQRLREAERGTLTVTAAVVCVSCRPLLVASGGGPGADVPGSLRARIQQLRSVATGEDRRSA
jgi:hypothetical protein